MILIGRQRSPYTRRVAINLRLQGIAYELRPQTAWTDLADLRAANPVGRIPPLILDSGETLFDSGAIVDYIDTLAGPARALVPSTEPDRHHVLRVVACAMGALDKIAAALYERTQRPADKIHEPWIRHNEDQARSALAWLEAIESELWLYGDTLTQADITTTCLLDFARLVSETAYPRLFGHSARCNALPAFAETYPRDEVDQANPQPGS